MTVATLQQQWMRLLFDSLAAAGVTDVVCSPGSRSTPLLWAAHAHGGLRLWDIIDERAAAFFALGQARISGRPSLLLCTSGTAGAHYFPALLEAEAAQLPLLIATADRPFELQQCAAPQTLDQLKLFGDHVRGFFELGLPDASDLSLRALRRLATQAVFQSQWPRPGAVHLNVRARKPLEPQPLASDDDQQLDARVRSLLGTPALRIFTPHSHASATGIQAAAQLCQKYRRGVIVCGPAPVGHTAMQEALVALSQVTGFALLCDATSQQRFVPAPLQQQALRCDAFDALLRCPQSVLSQELELVIQLGAPSTSSSLEQLLNARPELPRIVIAASELVDPHSSAQLLLLGEPAQTVEALLKQLQQQPPQINERWSVRLAAQEALAWTTLQAQLEQTPASPLSEHVAVRTVLTELPKDALLMLGNSLPIREVDLVCPSSAVESQVQVLSQRGVNGIDGLLASAAGSASLQSRPLTLLLGDVSFLHDQSSLGLLKHARAQVTVVVLQNHGGRIFEQLPVARSAQVTPQILSHFTTPHSLQLAPLATLHGIHYAHVSDQPALTAALRAAHQKPGVTLIEAEVPPHSAAEGQRAYVTALQRAIAAWPHQEAP